MLQDRAFIEQMKADILRRAEAMSDDEEEEDDTVGGAKGKGADVAFEDELDEEGAVKVRDGQPSEDEGEQETDDEDGAVCINLPTSDNMNCSLCCNFRLALRRNLRQFSSLLISGIPNCSTGMRKHGGANLARISKARQVRTRVELWLRFG